MIIGNYIISYDIASIPNNWDLDMLLESFKMGNILFYDSTKGNKPGFIKLNEGSVDLCIKDTSKPDGIHTN